jgi:hypothetical protein
MEPRVAPETAPSVPAPLLSEDLARLRELKLEKLHYFYTVLNEKMPAHQRMSALKMLLASDRPVAMRACSCLLGSEGKSDREEIGALLAEAAKMIGDGRHEKAVPLLVSCLTAPRMELRRSALFSLSQLTDLRIPPPADSTRAAWHDVQEKFQASLPTAKAD